MSRVLWKKVLVGVVLSGAAVLLLLLVLFLDPHPVGFEPTDLTEMVLIEGGVFPIGDRQQKVEIPAFYMDRFEVTVADWRRYAWGTSQPFPDVPADEPLGGDYPVRYVDRESAAKYASWYFKRLPDNREWDRASRGRGGFALPWGDAFIHDAANTLETWTTGGGSHRVTRVGTFEIGKTEAGVYDMIGNVWEWTSSDWGDHLSPLDDADFEFGVRLGENQAILRGGSFRSRGFGRERKTESTEPPRTSSWDIGFRCVISRQEVELQQRLIPWIAALGYRDTVRVIFLAWPAERHLVAEGRAALPYLRRARKICGSSSACDRIDRVIHTIESETEELES